MGGDRILATPKAPAAVMRPVSLLILWPLRRGSDAASFGYVHHGASPQIWFYLFRAKIRGRMFILLPAILCFQRLVRRLMIGIYTRFVFMSTSINTLFVFPIFGNKKGRSRDL
ncbi:hypothetical protein [Ochrobactrum chromiisoli]|uniref:hypothetical protein n=1 Tax=Ochrobactrum chromiisoli TaxID=2993941 RepID=UPI002248BAC0|nr:hypothetical protein [Ochrobactrum chromiisoli]